MAAHKPIATYESKHEHDAHERVFDDKGLLIEHHDYAGAKVGMWLFLFTELLLFGGMFLIYAINRAKYTAEFHATAVHLNTGIGALNTLLLLTSSLTMAISISAIQRGNKKASLIWLWATILMGLGFMVNKYFEWAAKFEHHIYPSSSWYGENLHKGQQVFYNLYFVMTGLHGLHVVIGMALLLIMVGLIHRKKVHQKDFVLLENSGLYWHLVDLIWIYLFPLFYLIS